MDSQSDTYQWCDESVANLLTGGDRVTMEEVDEERVEDRTFGTSTDILEYYTRMGFNTGLIDLRHLAEACERHFATWSAFPPSSVLSDSWCRQLWQTSSQSGYATLYGVLLCTSRIESRLARRYPPGRAPLLKDLVQQPDLRFGDIFQRVLLPKGLNLRNLVWHGFLPAVDRCWLALLVVLLDQIDGTDEAADTNPSPNDSLPVVMKIFLDRMADVTSVGHHLAADPGALQTIQNWLPASHRRLYQWIITDFSSKRISAAMLLTLLLEHAVRLEWCEANDRSCDQLARHDRYYVTLDGHGQRQQHDNVLRPVLRDGSDNEWAQACPRVVALLADVYMSPYGCNLRAALTHGSLEYTLEQDLVGDNEESSPYSERLCDVVWACVGAASGAVSLPNYRPLFSYTARVRDDLTEVRKYLLAIYCHEAPQALSESPSSLDVPLELVEGLRIPFSNLESMMASFRGFLNGPVVAENFDRRMLLYEYRRDQELAPRGAGRTLLTDLTSTLGKYHKALALVSVKIDSHKPLSSRERKHLVRVVACRDIVYAFASFATMVALVALSPSRPDFEVDLLKATERTRMVTSTVDTFLLANTERAIKSVAEYARGKQVKAIMAHRMQLCDVQDSSSPM